MKIVVITSDKIPGSVYHRLVTQHIALAKVYDDVKVTFASGISALTDEQIAEFDIVAAHESYWDVGTIDRAKSLGVKAVYDIDDYWQLEPFMMSYHRWKHLNMKFLVLNTASHCDLVTCTTPILQASLRKEIKIPVEVMPNGVDPDDAQWRVSPPPDWDGFRVGYVGAIEHAHDLRQMFGVENVFETYIVSTFPDIPKGFKTFNGRKFFEYPYIYETIDVCVAPLIVSRFNRHKSELKMIEAGFKKKPIVVSAVEPFTLLISDKNCLTVTKERAKDWIKQIQRLKDSPALREDLSEELYREVNEKYDLKKLAVKRRRIYDELLLQ